jgi:hypothetical protein
MAIHDQGHQMMNQAFEKSPILPDDTKKMYSYWNDFIKQKRENCKESVDSSFDGVKEFFAESDPVCPIEKPVDKSSVRTSK